jgi:hypothetical protein
MDVPGAANHMAVCCLGFVSISIKNDDDDDVRVVLFFLSGH